MQHDEKYSDLFDEVLAAVKADPEAIIRERRTEQVLALKLLIPEKILARKKLMRHKFAQFEAAQAQCDKRKTDLAYLIKSEVDDVTNKPRYHNRESRESELQARLADDSSYTSWHRVRNSMYSDFKSLEDEVDYYERIDLGLVEACAMLTAQVEFYTRFDRSYNDDHPTTKARSARRASERARVAAEPRKEATGTA
jgi:hypothetical protein